MKFVVYRARYSKDIKKPKTSSSLGFFFMYSFLVPILTIFFFLMFKHTIQQIKSDPKHDDTHY